MCAVAPALASEGDDKKGGTNPLTGQPNLILQVGHVEEIVGRPSLSPDGRLAVTMDQGRTVIVWDVATGRQLRRLLPGEEGEGNLFLGSRSGKGSTRVMDAWHIQAAFSPNGRIVAATAEQGATLWDVGTGRTLRELKAGSTSVWHIQGVAFSPDGKRLVVPKSVGSGFVVLDVDSGSEIYEVGSVFATLSGRSPFQVIAWSPDGRYIAGATTLDCPRELQRHVAGKFVAPCAIRVYDAAEGTELKVVESVHMHNRNFAFSPDGKWLAAMGPSGIHLHETGSWTEKKVLSAPTAALAPAETLSFSPDGKWLAAGGRTLKRWDTANDWARLPDVDLPFPTFNYAWMKDGEAILAFGKKGVPQVVSLQPSSSASRDAGRPDIVSGMGTAVAVDRDGRRLAVAAGEGGAAHIDVWDLKAGAPSRRMPTEGEGKKFFRQRNRLLFVPDGSQLVFTGAKGIEIWDTQTATKKFTLPGKTDVSLAGDGRLLAAGAGVDGLLLYDIQSGTRIAALKGPIADGGKADIGPVAISPDGRWVAGHQNGKGGTVRIWNVQSGQEASARPSFGGSSLLHFDHKGRLYYQGDYSGGPPLSVWDPERGAGLDPPAKVAALPWRWAYENGRFALCCVGDTRIMNTENGKLWPLRDSRFIGGAVDDIALFPDGRHIALAGSDGTVRILTQDTGELLITLLSISGSDDWLAFTPDGLFDGTPGGWDALLWRFSDELYDVAPGEAFFNEFYRPGLLAEIMAGGRPKPPRSLAEVDRRQPKISLQVTGGSERLAKVRIDVREAPPGGGRSSGSGVKDVRLFRNGSLVKYWKGEVGAGGTALETAIPIVAGENRFTAYAFNRDNIKSGDARAQVTGAETLKRPATAWVLAFGINRYANPAFNLGFSVADAHAYAEQIKAGQSALGRYQKINLVTLKDQEATKANLLAAIRRLAGTERGPLPKGAPKALAELVPAQPEDAVFIFFAGHGMAEEPRFYLIPHDMVFTGKMEQIDTAKATILKHAISDLELEDALEALDAERLVLTIDACHSGQALEATEKRRGPMNSKGLAQLAYEKGMYVITAAQSHQAALEFDQLGHGLLTYALIKEGLGKNLADKQPQDGRIDVREWLDYASTRVPQLQLDAMQDLEKRGRKVAVVRGEETEADVLKRSLQQPRIFYRREPERTLFVVGGK
jgi:WD40 repeat protein